MKMKLLIKSIVITLLISLGLLNSGCSSKDEALKPNAIEGECVIAGEDAPAWACGAYEDAANYAAVGSAPMSKLGHNYTRREALANARSSLSHQIQVDVKDKVDSFMRLSGVADAQLAEKVTSQVSKQVSEVTLEGSKQISYWENEGDSSIYVLVAVSKDAVTKSAKESVINTFSTDEALKQQKNALEALNSAF
jgi:hypothetical protein